MFFILTILCNAAFVVCDVAAFRFYLKRKNISTALQAIAIWGAALAFICLIILPLNRFYFARLAAYAAFLHAPIVCIGFGILLFRTHRLLSAAAFASLAVILAVAADAFLIEPKLLEVGHYEIRSPKIRSAVRIVVVADLQTSDFGPYEKEALRLAVEQKPDLLLFAGDYVQSAVDSYESQYAKIQSYLSELKIRPRLGAFAVRGNCEPPNWPDAFVETGIQAVDSSESLRLADLNLTCLSLEDSFYTAVSVPNPDESKFHLVLGHGPHYAWGEINADLLLAGHTHGGQVRIPFVGPLTANAPIPMSWAAGLTRLKSGVDLIVSRGIGMERGLAPPIRFNCRPEVTVIDLTPNPPK